MPSYNFFSRHDWMMAMYTDIFKNPDTHKFKHQRHYDTWKQIIEIFCRTVCIRGKTKDLCYKNGKIIPVHKGKITSLRSKLKERFGNENSSQIFEKGRDSDCVELYQFFADIAEPYFSSTRYTLRHTLQCTRCGTERTPTMNPQSLLTLHRPVYSGTKTVTDLLHQSFLEEEIDCACDGPCNAPYVRQKSKDYSYVPHVDTIVIQIERCGAANTVTNRDFGGLNTSKVDILSDDGRVTFLGVQYRLLAAIYHIGKTIDQGHYVVDCIRMTTLEKTVDKQCHRRHFFDDRTSLEFENAKYHQYLEPKEKDKRMEGCQLLMYVKDA